MSVFIPALFALAALAATLAIISSVKRALPAIHILRIQSRETSTGMPITMRTVSTRDVPLSSAMCRAGAIHRRKARPKPVTHRLHRFPHHIDAA